MTKEMTCSSNRYLITPSLLNSWAYIWTCVDGVKESEKDEICLEDKKQEAMLKAEEDFIKTLKRIPSETNFFMQQGIDFENDCYEGKTEFSKIIENGSFQIVGTKKVEIDGIKFLMYGRLDVLKGGVIYDIKRNMKYTPQKYLKSYQHSFYFSLFPNAYKFEYLVYDGKYHKETYYRDNSVDINEVIKMFIKWLIKENLIDIYLEKWKCKGD